MEENFIHNFRIFGLVLKTCLVTVVFLHTFKDQLIVRYKRHSPVLSIHLDVIVPVLKQGFAFPGKPQQKSNEHESVKHPHSVHANLM